MTSMYGIAFGTASCYVGVWRNSSVDIVFPESESRKLPSFVAFRDGDCLIGDSAKYQVARNAKNTIYSFKRLLCGDLSSAEIERFKKTYTYKFDTAPDNDYVFEVEVDGKSQQLPLSNIISRLLIKVRQFAESSGDPIQTPLAAVIAVPTRFTLRDRQLLTASAVAAGISATLITEPLAVALGCALKRSTDINSPVPRKVFVYDHGAGGLQVALVSIGQGAVRVLAADWVADVGGEDFDTRLMEHFIKEFKVRHGLDMSDNPKSLHRLRAEVERARAVLSTVSAAALEVDGLYEMQDLHTRITRDSFEQLCGDMFERCGAAIAAVMRSTQVRVSEVDEVLVVGGCSRMPRVQQLLTDYFPVKDLSRVLNADEAVAFGAAVQGGLLSGAASDKLQIPTISDCLGQALAVEVAGGGVQVALPIGTGLPAKRALVFATSQDNQAAALVRLVEMPRNSSAGSVPLAQLVVNGLPLLQKGRAQVEVTVEVKTLDAITVTARNVATGERVQAAAATVAPPAEPSAGSMQLVFQHYSDEAPTGDPGPSTANGSGDARFPPPPLATGGFGGFQSAAPPSPLSTPTAAPAADMRPAANGYGSFTGAPAAAADLRVPSATVNAAAADMRVPSSTSSYGSFTSAAPAATADMRVPSAVGSFPGYPSLSAQSSSATPASTADSRVPSMTAGYAGAYGGFQAAAPGSPPPPTWAQADGQGSPYPPQPTGYYPTAAGQPGSYAQQPGTSPYAPPYAPHPQYSQTYPGAHPYAQQPQPYQQPPQPQYAQTYPGPQPYSQQPQPYPQQPGAYPSTPLPGTAQPQQQPGSAAHMQQQMGLYYQQLNPEQAAYFRSCPPQQQWAYVNQWLVMLQQQHQAAGQAVWGGQAPQPSGTPQQAHPPQ